MTEVVEAEATRRTVAADCLEPTGTECVRTVDEVADFMWSCDEYGAYIDQLREPTP